MTERMIRQAMPEDRTAILDLNTRAFGREDEANIITKLQKDGDILLEFVAHEDDQILGHILFYPIGVFGRLGAIGLGPMCVDPWVQRDGIGSNMVAQGLNFVKQQGAPIVFVLGHKEYYPRFGFSEEATAEFQTPLKGPHFMGIRFRFGPPMSGRLIFPDAFGIADLA